VKLATRTNATSRSAFMDIDQTKTDGCVRLTSKSPSTVGYVIQLRTQSMQLLPARSNIAGNVRSSRHTRRLI